MDKQAYRQMQEQFDALNERVSNLEATVESLLDDEEADLDEDEDDTETETEETFPE